MAPRITELFAAGWALTRPFNCLITAISVGVGALTSSGLAASPQVVAAAASAALIAAAGNVYNDLRDLEIDRINRPNRPLPSGRISTRATAIEAAALGLAGWLLSFWLGPYLWAISTGVVAGLYLYSSHLKSTVLWGNLLVSGLAAAAFPYGALAAGGMGRTWLPASFAFLFHFSREIIKDMEDVVGDRRRGVSTLALVAGPRRAAAMAVSSSAILMVVTLVPWVMGIYGLAYLVAIGVMDALLVLVAFRVIRSGGRLTDQRLSRILTVGMLLGLLAIVLGESL